MDPRLLAIETDFLDRYFAFHPGAALFAGIHGHDHRLEDLTPAAIEGLGRDLDRLRSQAVGLGTLELADQIERDVLLARLDEVLHEYRVTEPWRRDPFWYAEVLSSQLNLLVIFDFAPLEDRLRAVVAKERAIPRYLDVARENLRPTAPILVDYGLRGMRGALSLVAKELKATFAGVTSSELLREFAESTTIAEVALNGFISWLEKDYPRGAERGFALGTERYASHLAAGERITTPLSELEAWAEKTIAETRELLAAECRRIDANASPNDVVEKITSDHPATGEVVREARRLAEDVYRWVEGRQLVSFPTAARVLIADTPEFMRWSFGSMWTPGPWEKADVRATFYATDADPSWSQSAQAEHLTAFCYRGLENLAIHEAYPGHFIQNLHQNRVESPVRRTFWWGVFGEGWAHYCEQMAVDEGFGAGAPEVRVVQLQEALTRLCRFVNGIRIHTRDDWSFDDGTRYFRERAWLAEAVAAAECERAAIDPFYLRYTLGKKLILDLREECKAKLGARFDLRAFHDALLDAGSAPMSSMRELVLLALGLAIE